VKGRYRHAVELLQAPPGEAPGEEVFSTRTEKKAIAEFNKIRREMEPMFPPTELTPEEKTRLLLKCIAESRVGLDHNSFRPEEKKKKSGSTRTFG
jgi:hypothetical protein